MSNILECHAIAKCFNAGCLRVEVLKQIDFIIEQKQSVAIIGVSGSGKSTLLHLLGGLDIPDRGEIWINGHNISDLNETQIGVLRNRYLGFVYQFHHLLPEFTALENVAMPLLVRREDRTQALGKAANILGRVGLSERLEHKPGELSGGERQRTAIARALVNNPVCILADEPTGNLDGKTADHVFELIQSLNQDFNTSLLMVTHNLELAKRVDRVLELKEGELKE